MALRIEDLDFAKLRAFQLVATHGTLGAAATQLGLTVPAISAKLKRLDEVLGVPLFKRLPNGLTLTPAGERFLRDLTPLLHDAEQALARVQAPDTARSGETGRITVAIGGDYAGYFVPRMHGFLVEFPRVELSMRVARRSDSLASLQAGNADFCMGVFPRLPQGIAAKVVTRTTLSLIGRSEAEAEAEPLEGRRLIIAPRGTALREVLRQSPHMEARPNILECPTCATALDLVRLGAGPAIVHTMCATHGEDLYARDLGDRHGLMQVVVAYRRGALRTRAAEAFYEHVTR